MTPDNSYLTSVETDGWYYTSPSWRVMNADHDSNHSIDHDMLVEVESLNSEECDSEVESSVNTSSATSEARSPSTSAEKSNQDDHRSIVTDKSETKKQVAPNVRGYPNNYSYYACYSNGVCLCWNNPT